MLKKIAVHEETLPSGPGQLSFSKPWSGVCSFPCFSSKTCENLAFSWLHVYLITVIRNYVDMKNKWSNIPSDAPTKANRNPLVIRLPFHSFIKLPTNYKILCKTKLLKCEVFSRYSRNAPSTTSKRQRQRKNAEFHKQTKIPGKFWSIIRTTHEWLSFLLF